MRTKAAFALLLIVALLLLTGAEIIKGATVGVWIGNIFLLAVAFLFVVPSRRIWQAEKTIGRIVFVVSTALLILAATLFFRDTSWLLLIYGYQLVCLAAVASMHID